MLIRNKEKSQFYLCTYLFICVFVFKQNIIHIHVDKIRTIQKKIQKSEDDFLFHNCLI